MPRPNVTGKYATVEELREAVLLRARTKNQSFNQIARICGISSTTVATIVKGYRA